MATENSNIRIGKISSIDYPKGTAKITYEDKGDSTTAFFSFLAWQYWMPKIGDQVLVAHLSNGTCAATILGPVWHDGHRPPEGREGLYRKDFNRTYGRAFERYDDKAETYSLEIGAVTIQITRGGKISITAPQGISITAPQVTVTGDVIAGGVSLDNHTHPGDSGGTTGKPN